MIRRLSVTTMRQCRHTPSRGCSSSSSSAPPPSPPSPPAAPNAYAGQDRGGRAAHDAYTAAMDAIALEKVASASSFFRPRAGEALVDVGMGSGASTALLAALFPQQRVLGLDVSAEMVAHARRAHPPRTHPNLRFAVDDAESLATLDAPDGLGMFGGAAGRRGRRPRVHGFFNCSSLHHVTSFNGYAAGRAAAALRRQAALLGPGGVIVVRDFLKAEERLVVLELRDDTASGGGPQSPPGGGGPNGVAALSDAELLLEFARTARSLAPAAERGFPVRELRPPPATARARRGGGGGGGAVWRRFELHYADAVEFIRRKDYREDWGAELKEEYGYFTQRQFEELFHSLGMRVVLSAPVHNRWIARHRYQGRLRLFDALSGADLGFPPTNYLIGAEKVGSAGAGLALVRTRHLPLPPRPYLRLEGHAHKATGAVYDVARRPGDAATDILPFFFAPADALGEGEDTRHAAAGADAGSQGGGGTDAEGGSTSEDANTVQTRGADPRDPSNSQRLYVCAKRGYPRPLASVLGRPAADGQTEAPPLDGKRFSGYVTEPFAAAAETLPAAPTSADEEEEGEARYPHRQPLSAAALADVLARRFGLPRGLLESAAAPPPPPLVLHGGYLPSAGAVGELVRSVAVPLPGPPPTPSWPLPDGHSGLAGAAGEGAVYDAGALLLAAQTGALPEARLELNLYRLHALLGRRLPPWLGERVVARAEEGGDDAGPPVTVSSLRALLSAPPRRDFAPSAPGGFLQLHRAHFSEEGATAAAAADSRVTLEYVSPRGYSEATVVTLPLRREAGGGPLLLGLEARDLPAPQLCGLRGGSRLLVAPARRLPHSVRTVQQLQQHLRGRGFTLDGGRRVRWLSRLGERYFPSLGISAEQVFPHLVGLSARGCQRRQQNSSNSSSSDGGEEEDENENENEGEGGATAESDASRGPHHARDRTGPASAAARDPPLVWVTAREALECADSISDGHTLIALMRLRHMLADAGEPW